ncbi:MAG: WXG100 family type VII secretion target [Lachnospiraceae bacterium]|nr:WXG100 family type VII secretion target [Lachnospiraceae bacterium]
MAGIQLKVTPDRLKEKSQEITNQINRFESYWKQLSQLVKNSKSYWVGDASNSHQKQLSDYTTDVERIIKRLREHPEELLEMAEIYEEAEEKAQSIASALPDDVII